MGIVVWVITSQSRHDSCVVFKEKWFVFRDIGAIVSSIVVVAVVAVVEILSLSSWSTEICRIGEFAFAEFECTADPCFSLPLRVSCFMRLQLTLCFDF